MDKNAPNLTQQRLIETCIEAKARANSTDTTERLYALVRLLQEMLGQNDPGSIISSNPSLRGRCDEALNIIFSRRVNRDPYYDATKIIAEHLLNDATD
jgi:hypothetical protein